MLWAWGEFLLCSAAIGFAGYRLARYGDVIAGVSGVSGTWVGIVLLATVTSLPELVTGIASVTVIDAPDIAVGDVMGSCVFNLLLIAVLDFFHRETPVYLKAGQGHILSAAFSIVLLGIVVFSQLAGATAALPIGHVGIFSPTIIALYVVAVRAIYVHERRTHTVLDDAATRGGMDLQRAIVGYLGSAAVVVAAGIAMPHAAVRLASVMGWGQSFVGTLLVAGATSLPEAASTLGALKIRAIDLAFGSLLGSNLFNVVVLAIDDFAYTKGPLLAHASSSHVLTAVSAIIMTGIAVIGLHYRPAMRIFRIAGWVSLGLLTIYILNSLVLYLRGH